jgi:hypothetical protein
MRIGSERRRRMGLLVSTAILALALVIAALPSLQGPSRLNGGDALGFVPRFVVIAYLLAIPGMIGLVASLRDARPLFMAAGLLCLLQSFVAFSLVTVGFLLPALVLLSLGRAGGGSAGLAARARRQAGAALVLGLGIAAWTVPFVSSGTVCWIARSGAQGSTVYERVPLTDTIALGPGVIAGGCDGGTFTPEGVTIAAILGIGAVALAWMASATASATR